MDVLIGRILFQVVVLAALSDLSRQLISHNSHFQFLSVDIEPAHLLNRSLRILSVLEFNYGMAFVLASDMIFRQFNDLYLPKGIEPLLALTWKWMLLVGCRLQSLGSARPPVHPRTLCSTHPSSAASKALVACPCPFWTWTRLPLGFSPLEKPGSLWSGPWVSCQIKPWREALTRECRIQRKIS